jgi:tetratricopeptide (TPR) repeat protein
MLLLFSANNDLNSKLFSLARSSYRYLRRSFDFTGKYPYFYFFTGLYLYYREAYPEAHPLYKPLLILFPRGDKDKGMRELMIAFEKSIFLRSEASDFLSSNYKYYENDFQHASYFSKTLFDHYPTNIEYRTDCIENYLLTGQYDEAEKLINEADLKNNSYFIAMMKIFKGIIDEKKYKDMKKAGQEYSEGVREISAYGDYGSQHAAYGYFGLSRISALNHDPAGQKSYRKKAEELTDFREINFDKP